MESRADVGHASARFVSTGALPATDSVIQLVDEAHRRFLPVDTGAASDVYPALAAADPDVFGLAVVSVDGLVHSAGDAMAPFALMSVAKPFVFAAVAQIVGLQRVRDFVGVNATGLPFNSVEALERLPNARTNPMVNPGAIATTSLIPGTDLEDRWALLVGALSRFAGRDLHLDESMLESALASNHVNRELGARLAGHGALAGDADDAVELYTRQSCLEVTALDLAVMGATLADGGVNPTTGERVIDAEIARSTLAVMAVAGLYETSGDWLLDVGMPGKSGIGGGIVTVSAGKGALGTFSPRLDSAGNSVRGILAAEFLTTRLGLDLFASAPAAPTPST
jgi:glutaminase